MSFTETAAFADFDDSRNPLGFDGDGGFDDPHYPIPDAALGKVDLSAGGTRPIDWAMVATLLAGGIPIVQVARVARCSRQTIWRALRRSRALRVRVEEERMARAAEAEARFGSLRQAVVDALCQGVSAGNARIVIWVAERLAIGAADFRRDSPAEPRPEEARKLAEAETEAARRLAADGAPCEAAADDAPAAHPAEDSVASGCVAPSPPPPARGDAAPAAAYGLPVVTAPEERGRWTPPEAAGALALEPAVLAGLGARDWDRAGALAQRLRESVAPGCVGAAAPPPPDPLRCSR